MNAYIGYDALPDRGNLGFIGVPGSIIVVENLALALDLGHRDIFRRGFVDYVNDNGDGDRRCGCSQSPCAQ
jgi:hypothetical protein